MDDRACPRCKTTKYRNPGLKFMVNVCGHVLCESCVDLLFLKGSGSCPDCNVPLRRYNFRIQMFDDPVVEKEIDIRKKVLKDFNKKEDDFETVAEYNDYLEEIESIIFNLCNDIEIINTNKKIDQYKKENRETIIRNKHKIGREQYELDELLEKEKLLEELRRNEISELEQEAKKKKLMEKEELIDQLMSSYEDASKIVTSFAEKAEKSRSEETILKIAKNAQFSTGIQFSRSAQQGFLPVPKEDEGRLYAHIIPRLWFNGPQAPGAMDIESNGFIKHIRSENIAERAGGYKSTIACQRALQEALQGLFNGT